MEVENQRCHDPYLRCALYGAAQAALGRVADRVDDASRQSVFR